MRKKLLTSLFLIGALIFTTVFAFAGTSISRYTGKSYSHNSRFDTSVMVNGLDVSVYQKTIDWQQAKADGIDFAIVRAGGRGYGAEGKMYSDDNFKQNIEGAKAAGVLVGIYFFSQAIDEMEAIAEARYAVELMNEAGVSELDLPIFMDYEFAGGSSGRLNQAKLSKAKATRIARAFCEEVKLLGYKPGIYANLNFLNNTIDGAALGKDYPIWAAQYYSQCDFTGDYTWWQYASSGTVSGINARNDCNFWYIERNPQATSAYSMTDAQVVLTGSSSYTYNNGKAFTPSVSVTMNGRSLTEGVDYNVRYVNNTQAGTAYAMVMGKGLYTDYRMVPFEIKPSTNLSGITVADIPDMEYTGTEQKPSSITVKDAAGRTLIKNLDYTYTVSNAVEAGTAKVNISFIGNYKGTRTAQYNINKTGQTIKIGNQKTEAQPGDAPFNLNVSLKFSGAKVTYSSSNTAVATVSSDGTVTVKGPGTTTITVKAAATGNVGSASKSFTLTVKNPSQVVTTSYTRYKRTELDKMFNLNARTDGDGTLSYKSSDESVAKVSSKGGVTVVGPGIAEITVTAAETASYGEGKKVVTLTVSALDEDEKEAKAARLTAGVEKTTVVSAKATELSGKKIKVEWKKKNSGYDVDYYQVYRSTKKTSGFKKIYTTKDSKEKSVINFRDVKSNTTYWYKIRGVRCIDGKLVYTPYTKISVKTKK